MGLRGRGGGARRGRVPRPARLAGAVIGCARRADGQTRAAHTQEAWPARGYACSAFPLPIPASPHPPLPRCPHPNPTAAALPLCPFPPEQKVNGGALTLGKTRAGAVTVKGAQNTARVTRPDIVAGNVTIHVIDDVLLPPTVRAPARQTGRTRAATGPGQGARVFQGGTQLPCLPSF